MDGEDIFASSAFVPLPFRVLSLVGLGILCWATNLHILRRLGIDTASVLETRTEHKIPLSSPPSPWPPSSSPPSPTSSPQHLHNVRPRYASNLYPPVYRLFLAYAIWTVSIYVLFNMAVHGNMQLMDSSRHLVSLAVVGAAAGLLCPFNILQRRERNIFLTAIKRCLFTTSSQPVYFADVILADIFTSFAKVLGDCWVSACMLLPGGSLRMSALDIHGWSEWMIPVLISLPYVVRFRQCLSEYWASGGTNTRSLLNAVKYATSFPVIFLSAMQKLVIQDIAAAKGAEEAAQSTWHGEYHIFRFWFFSVCVSSLYSFWWDVTNDWGLDLLRSSSAAPSPLPSPAIRLPLSRASSNPNLTSDLPVSNTLSTPVMPYIRTHPYGLRPSLLFGYPMVYYSAIVLNFILRFTWSMKLSTHLHTFAELETGVFVVEACELLRRWLWVFFRVEWEACKKGMMPDVLGGATMGEMEMHEAITLTAPSPRSKDTVIE